MNEGMVGSGRRSNPGRVGIVPLSVALGDLGERAKPGERDEPRELAESSDAGEPIGLSRPGKQGGLGKPGELAELGGSGESGGLGRLGGLSRPGKSGVLGTSGHPGSSGGFGEQVDPMMAAGADEQGESGSGVVRLVLVDDHRLFRAGVRAELAEVSAGSIDIVGEAADAPEAVAVIGAMQPDVVLLDVHLPGGGGIEVLRRCTAPGIRFLALSVSDAAQDVIGVVRGGARGYVTKSIGGAELADAIRRVAGGDAVFSPRLAGFVLDAFSAGGGSGDAIGDSSSGGAGDEASARGKGGTGTDVSADGSAGVESDPDLDRLTSREREVLRLIARGYAYKEIARELVISNKTVESHVSSVLRKLQLSNRYELSRWASDRRLL